VLVLFFTRRFSVSSTESAGVIGENGVEVEVLMITSKAVSSLPGDAPVAVEFSGDAAGKTTEATLRKILPRFARRIKGVG